MATIKPNLTRTWASGAPSGNVIDPDTTTPGKFAAGWLAEVPPFEHFNFLQQLFTQGLAHNNEQGINKWDIDTVYPINGLAKGSNGLVYEAILEQSANDPVSDDGTNWILFDTSSTTEFKTIADLKIKKTSSGKTISVKAGQSLRTLGALAIGDGGGANYYVSTTASINAFNFDLGGGFVAVLVHHGVLNSKAAGLYTDGTNASANNIILEGIKDYLQDVPIGNKPSLQLPPGEIAYNISPNWWDSGTHIFGLGPDYCVLKYSGSSRAVDVSPTSSGMGFKYGIKMSGFRVDCGANGTSGMYLVNIAHCKFSDIAIINGAANAIHWDIQLNVLNHFDTCSSPLSRYAITSSWFESFRLAASFDGANTTACTFTNIIAEGATNSGIRLIAADNNTFIGGTSESNSGRGVTIAPTVCRNNKFIDLDMESNIVQDFNDAGDSTIWDNCLSTSPSGSEISGSSRLAKITGGLYELITVSSGAIGTSIFDVFVNTNGAGGLVDNGAIDLVYRGVYDKTAGSFIHQVKDRVGLTLGASPWTYTNTSDIYENLLINGGDVSSITIDRNGNTFDVPFVSPSFTLLAPGDSAIVIYSVSPTKVWSIPQNEFRG